jgi:hypothetical protein
MKILATILENLNEAQLVKILKTKNSFGDAFLHYIMCFTRVKDNDRIVEILKAVSKGLSEKQSIEVLAVTNKSKRTCKELAKAMRRVDESKETEYEEVKTCEELAEIIREKKSLLNPKK